MNNETDKLNETSVIQDVSRSVDQLCTQLSLINVSVPRFTDFKDVFEFLSEFDTATSALLDDQKLVVLARAFPIGRYRSWYETELSPLIKSKKSWSTVRSTIINRFSDSEDKDRHFMRIRDLRYDPNSDNKLLDFVEDMIYSYKRAYPNSTDQESCTRFIKAALPSDLKATLCNMSEYREATTEEQFKKVARQYDLSRGGIGTSRKQNDANVTSELASILKEVINGIRREGETTRNAIVAALASQNSYSTRGNDQMNRYNRSQSPRGSYNNSPRQTPRSPSPAYGRSPSPRRNSYSSDSRNPKLSAQNTNEQRPVSKLSDSAFCSETYWQKWGKPPKPCSNCGHWHWSRHCLFNLKE